MLRYLTLAYSSSYSRQVRMNFQSRVYAFCSWEIRSWQTLSPKESSAILICFSARDLKFFKSSLILYYNSLKLITISSKLFLSVKKCSGSSRLIWWLFLKLRNSFSISLQLSRMWSWCYCSQRSIVRLKIGLYRHSYYRQKESGYLLDGLRGDRFGGYQLANERSIFMLRLWASDIQLKNTYSFYEMFEMYFRFESLAYLASYRIYLCFQPRPEPIEDGSSEDFPFYSSASFYVILGKSMFGIMSESDSSNRYFSRVLLTLDTMLWESSWTLLKDALGLKDFL